MADFMPSKLNSSNGGQGICVDRYPSCLLDNILFEQVPGHVLVAGSVGPYGACLGDGSEYTGAYLQV